MYHSADVRIALCTIQQVSGWLSVPYSRCQVGFIYPVAGVMFGSVYHVAGVMFVLCTM